MSSFQRAERRKAKARIALTGPTGSGKTYTALLIAMGLVGEGGRVAGIDTEKGSMALYADLFGFDHAELDPPFSPARYIELINMAAAEGYDALIIDSLSHGWSDEGGVLDIVDAAGARAQGNRFAGWREGTPAQNMLVNAILRAPLHVIATMRTKTEWVVEQNEKGKSRPRKIGTAPIQRDQIEYEFTIVGEIDQEHNLVVTKSRMKDLADEMLRKPGVELGVRIKDWLEAGIDVPVAPAVRSEEATAALDKIRKLITGELIELGLVFETAQTITKKLEEPVPTNPKEIGEISDGALIALLNQIAPPPGKGDEDGEDDDST